MDKTFCDLCGHEIVNYDYEKDSMKHYKIKEYRWFGDCCGWVKLDAHPSCIKHLLEEVKKNKNGRLD